MQQARLQKLLDFLDSDPQDPFIKYALASEYLKLNDHEQALHYFEDLRINHPDYSGTYYHLGKLYETIGNIEEAIIVYKEGISVTISKAEHHAASELRAALLNIDDIDGDYE